MALDLPRQCFHSLVLHLDTRYFMNTVSASRAWRIFSVTCEGSRSKCTWPPATPLWCPSLRLGTGSINLPLSHISALAPDAVLFALQHLQFAGQPCFDYSTLTVLPPCLRLPISGGCNRTFMRNASRCYYPGVLLYTCTYTTRKWKSWVSWVQRCRHGVEHWLSVGEDVCF